MKKLMLMLMVVAMAAPLFAQGQVTFVATDNNDGTCTITFDANDLIGVHPVAMALEVHVTGSDPSHKITAVSGMDGFFDIYMDYAYDMESDPCGPGYSYGAGNPIAQLAQAGKADLPLWDFVISMGGLGGPSLPLNSAPDNGTAFVLTAGNNPFDPCDPCDIVTGSISLNALRGGVIGTDTEAMDTNINSLPFTITPQEKCYPTDAPGYQTWLDYDEPDCWCYEFNCKGDTDNVGTGRGVSKKWVVLADLQLLGGAWVKPESDPLLPVNYQCANFDRVGTGRGASKKWVVLGDLQILGGGWVKPVSHSHFATNPCPGW